MTVPFKKIDKLNLVLLSIKSVCLYNWLQNKDDILFYSETFNGSSYNGIML